MTRESTNSHGTGLGFNPDLVDQVQRAQKAAEIETDENFNEIEERKKAEKDHRKKLLQEKRRQKNKRKNRPGSST